MQYAAEQGVEAVFRRQCPAHVHEVAQGQSHAGHGTGQIVDLADRRFRHPALAEVEVLDPLRLLSQGQQGVAVRRETSQITGNSSSKPASAQPRLISASLRACW